MIEIESDEECIDDPIRLFDFEQDRVFCCPVRKDNVEDAEDNIRFNINRLDYEETVNSYKNNSSILPVTFFDIERNVELLNQCRPLIVKLVDCERFPSYHKWKINFRDYSNSNLNKSDLKEADCIVILSSDENENDVIFKQRTVGNKKFSKGFVSKNDKTSERNPAHDTINSYQNNKVIDLKDSQGNIIDGKFDNKTRMINDNPHSYQNIHDDRMNIYAKIIDKAYKKLTSRDIEKPFEENKTRSISNRSGKPDCLVDYTKINCSDLNNSAKNKFNEKNRNTRAKLLNSQTVSNVKNSISEKNKRNNIFIQEMQIVEGTIGYNNGSSSPLLPCPSKTKRSDQINGIHMISDTPLSSYNKHKININVCKDQLFSAKRVIPHYHYETVYATQCKPFNLKSNISKNETLKTGSLQTNIESVSFEVSDKNQDVSNQCNKNKRTKLVDPNISKINDITHNNHPISNGNRISSLDHVTPLCKKQCCSQVNLSQKQTACNLKREKSSNLGVNMTHKIISSLDTTKGNSNPIPIGNSILLDRQAKKVHYNNYITPTFPIKRVESNRCNSHSNDLTFQPGSALLAKHHPSQNLYQSSIHPNNTYNLEHSLSSMPSSRKTVAVCENNLSPSFYSIPPQLTPINLLPEYQSDDRRISSIQFQHHYNNRTENVDRGIKSMNRKSSSDVNRNIAIASVIANGQNVSKALENTKHPVTSEVDHKYPYLKQCLNRPPLLNNKRTNANREKRKCVNNTPSTNLDDALNKGYSPPILPIPTYQKTFEILAKIKLYDFDRGFSQPDSSDNNWIPSSQNFYVLEKTASKRKINDEENVSRNITIDDYKKRMSGDSIR